MTDLYPALGTVFEDAEGRELTVHGVFPGDRLGREVRGRVVSPDGQERDYATSQQTWAAVWRDRAPRAVIRQ